MSEFDDTDNDADDTNDLDTQDSDGIEAQGQGAASATVDPMSMVKQALAFGRQKHGLPTNFSTGQTAGAQTMGFDDGGMIPDQTQGGDGGESGDDQSGGAVTGGGNMPDPRQALAYLTGDGAVSPEIAQALEQHVDPQRQMDQADRTMATISAAPNPEAKFGMMQHYRTKYNGYAAGARAALDTGNVGQAAMHATQAFAHVPTDAKVKFAPAQGGIAVMSSNRGTPALDSTRQFMGAGLMGKAPVQAADDAWEKYHGSGGTLSMEDGGEVDDPEETQGVLPDVGEAAASAAPEDVGDAEGDASATPTQATDQNGQPVVLSPDQFKKLMQAGYDKPLDEGWSGLLHSIMGALGPSSAEAGTLPQPGQPHPADIGGGQSVVQKNKSDRLPGAAAGALTPQDRAGATSPAKQTAPTNEFGEGDKKFGHYQERVEKLAARLFPFASQADQRNAYIGHEMSKYMDSENKIDQGNASGRQGIGAIREANKLTIARENNDARGQRQQASAASREGIATKNNLTRMFTAAQNQQVRILGQQLAADPSLAKNPDKALARVQQLAGQLGVNPKELLTHIQEQQGGAAQPQPTGGPGAPSPKPTVVVFPSGPHAGKPMIRQPDGTYVLAPGQ